MSHSVSRYDAAIPSAEQNMVNTHDFLKFFESLFIGIAYCKKCFRELLLLVSELIRGR